MLSVILYHFILFLIIHEFQDRKREFRLRRNDKFVRRCQGGEDGKKESKSRLTCFFFTPSLHKSFHRRRLKEESCSRAQNRISFATWRSYFIVDSGRIFKKNRNSCLSTLDYSVCCKDIEGIARDRSLCLR